MFQQRVRTSTETPEGTPDAALAASLARSLDTLGALQQREPVRVLVSALPNIPLVSQPDIRNRNFYLGMTCGQLWSRLKICRNLRDWSTPDELLSKTSIVQAKNAVIRQAVEAAQGRHPSLQIAFSDRIFHHPLRAEDLAGDCFHPNQQSQERLAAELWQDQPWFGRDSAARGGHYRAGASFTAREPAPRAPEP